MKLHLRDWIATLLVAAVIVPYVGYLVRGTMPLVQDPRGMAAIGLMLGVAALVVADRQVRHRAAEGALAGVAVLLGVVAAAFAETFLAEVLLAVFMVSIVVVLAVHLLEQAGVTHRGATGLPARP